MILPGHMSIKKALALLSACLVVLGLAGFKWIHMQQANHYDVIVVGAGPGGIAAAVQATRMGARVALFEPTDWVGGQMTAAGVGNMDEGNVAVRTSGLYKEFADQVTAYYKSKGKSVNTCYYDIGSLCIDPQVGRTILGQMLAAQGSNLHLFTSTPVTSVLKHGTAVTGVVAAGKSYHASVVIDADEYGDVLAEAGAAYRLGNSTSDNINPKTCVQDITYTAVMKAYPKGVPSELQFKKPPPGYNQTIASHFKAFLTSNGYESKLVKPTDHFMVHKQPDSFKSYAAYRGLPDLSNPKDYTVLQQNGQDITRTSLNLGNDYPMSGTLSVRYISDPAYRQQVACRAKLLTLQLAYYIQHDLHESDWSLANDEGYDTPYNQQGHCSILEGYSAFEDQMPVEPYVREGRRLIGQETLTGDQLVYSWKNKQDIPTYPDSVAVGYYPMDLHQCYAPNTLESAFDTADDRRATFNGGAFEVPIGVLIPQTVDGLLAAEKNISASRLANGAIREQPIAMDIGQAAGALAALAAKNHTQPRYIAPGDVQAALHAANTTISIGKRA